MPKKIDSDALQILTKSLGLTGAGAQETELMDGVVDQSLNVVPIIRRGRTLSNKEGIFTATMRVILTDIERVALTVDPYNVGTTAAIAPYPTTVPAQFDLWLLAAAIRQVSGTGTLDASLAVRYQGQQGWGIDDGGLFIGAEQAHRVAHWNGIIDDGSNFGILAGSLQPTAFLGMRLPRGFQNRTELIFTATSSATSTWDCQLTLGMFPVALGQDGLV